MKADRSHLSKYGRMITGDLYIAMEDGPVPSRIYDILKTVRGDGLFSEEKRAEFESYFKITEWMYVTPLKSANLDILSESDIEELDNSLNQYGSMSWSEIREKSHDFAWHNTPRDHAMDIRNIMRENNDDENFIAFVSEQVTRQL